MSYCFTVYFPSFLLSFSLYLFLSISSLFVSDFLSVSKTNLVGWMKKKICIEIHSNYVIRRWIIQVRWRPTNNTKRSIKTMNEIKVCTFSSSSFTYTIWILYIWYYGEMTTMFWQLRNTTKKVMKMRDQAKVLIDYCTLRHF